MSVKVSGNHEPIISPQLPSVLEDLAQLCPWNHRRRICIFNLWSGHVLTPPSALGFTVKNLFSMSKNPAGAGAASDPGNVDSTAVLVMKNEAKYVMTICRMMKKSKPLRYDCLMVG